MPFLLITGVPGHGKTSLLMEHLAEAVALNNKHIESGKTQITVNGVELVTRPIYAAGIDGLVEGLVENLEDPTQWESLPDGSLIYVDECWKWFGHLQDASRKPPPKHVQGIAEHRHKGMDFIGTSQGPNQIYPFMRSLIGPHWHVVRRFGTQLIDVYKWGELVEDVKSQGNRDRGVKDSRSLPTKQRPLYKSASAHTIKPQLPKRMIITAAAMLLVLPLIYFGIKMMRPSELTSKIQGTDTPSLLGESVSESDGPKAKDTKKELTPGEWAAQLLPRIIGVHGSQPIFDGREAKSEPATFCALSGPGLDGQGKQAPGRCRCFTEQATVIEGVLPEVCRRSARFGQYDPFRQSLAETSGTASFSQGSTETVALERVTLGESWDKPRVIPGAVVVP